MKLFEDAGAIKGYGPVIDAASVGYGMTLFCTRSADTPVSTTISRFDEVCAAMVRLRECHLMAGECDVLLPILNRFTALENPQTQRVA